MARTSRCTVPERTFSAMMSDVGPSNTHRMKAYNAFGIFCAACFKLSFKCPWMFQLLSNIPPKNRGRVIQLLNATFSCLSHCFFHSCISCGGGITLYDSLRRLVLMKWTSSIWGVFLWWLQLAQECPLHYIAEYLCTLVSDLRYWWSCHHDIYSNSCNVCFI